jgi:hypothetical protein
MVPYDIWILQDQKISVSFDTRGYTFYRGGQGILGDPVEAYLRLVGVKGEEKVLLPQVSDLQGRVRLRTPEQALEFLRLFSAINTHYLFPDYSYLEPQEDGEEPSPGEYAPAYAAHANLARPVARQQDGDFIVERNLLDRQNRLLRSRELVDPDGHYAMENTQIIDARAPISYPLYQ